MRIRLHSTTQNDNAPTHNRRRSRQLGTLAGVLARLFGARRSRVTGVDLRRHDYPTSTQRMGVRFTERIRDAFRVRWLRKTR